MTLFTQEMLDKLPAGEYEVKVSEILPGGGQRIELWVLEERRFTWLKKRKRWARSFTVLDECRSHEDKIQKIFLNSIYGKFGGGLNHD